MVNHSDDPTPGGLGARNGAPARELGGLRFYVAVLRWSLVVWVVSLIVTGWEVALVAAAAGIEQPSMTPGLLLRLVVPYGLFQGAAVVLLVEALRWAVGLNPRRITGGEVVTAEPARFLPARVPTTPDYSPPS